MSAACHACGQAGLEPLPGLETLGLVSSDCLPVDFRCTLALCPACGLVQKPVDEAWRAATARIYDAYQIYHQSGGLEQPVFQAGGAAHPRSEQLLGWALGQIDLPEQGLLADVGCGNGGFLRAFSRRRPGWRLAGLEWGGRHREFVLGIPGVECFEPAGLDGLEGLIAARGQRDLIVLIHALEHLPGPRQALARLRQALRPEGLLLILVPVHAQNPFDLLVADHCTHFCPATLERELVRAGFAVEALAPGTAIAKELAVLARRVERPAQAMAQAAELAEARRQARNSLDFLAAVLADAQDAARSVPVGIFGTSIGGVWLAAQLGTGAAFFVDEDEARVGRELLGLPVLRPAEIPAGAAVAVPLAPVVAQAAVRRMGQLHPGVRWLTVP